MNQTAFLRALRASVVNSSSSDSKKPHPQTGLFDRTGKSLDNFGENNNQGEQHQRLDKRESKNQRELNRRTSSRVAGHSFASRSTYAALSQTGQAGCDRYAETGRDSHVVSM